MSPKLDTWSSTAYENSANYVAKLTSTVVSWLDPQPDDIVLDVGCGDGELTFELSKKVSSITGIDGSANMISACQKQYPDIPVQVVDCRYLSKEAALTSGGFTKVFSNAALHWILRDPTTRASTIQACYDALNPGGIFVSESGALGNVCEVHAALVSALIHRGIEPKKAREASPWWFPSKEAMKILLEGAGFEWVKGETELRQTVLTGHEEGGLPGWVKLFGAEFLKLVDGETAKQEVVDEVCEVLEGVGRREEDGKFILNYIRLRFVAKKPEKP